MGGRLGLLAPSQAGYGAWGACRKAAASAERLLVRWSQEARATGQGANAKAAEEGVRFGQTIWLSWVLAVPCHQACSGALNFARHEGRLGGGYPDVSAAVPRYGGSLDVQLLAQVYRIQVPSCIFLALGLVGCVDGCWALLRRRARRKMLSTVSVRGAWLCGSVSWTSCGVLDGGDGHSSLSLATSSIL